MSETLLRFGGAPPVEVVVINWKRPANVEAICEVFAHQGKLATITLIEAAADPGYALPLSCLAKTTRLIKLRENAGAFNRFIPLLSYRREFTYFHDDDMIPGAEVIAHFLTEARSYPDFGIFGQIGRCASPDGYSKEDVRAENGIVETDSVVRGYFVRRQVLLHLPLWLEKLGDVEGDVDDLLLCTAAHTCGLKVGVIACPKPPMKMNSKEMPDPFAVHRTPGLRQRRSQFLERARTKGWQSVQDRLPAASYTS